VQSIAEEMGEGGYDLQPETARYEIASRDLEHLKATDSELADDIISATLAEVELREKIGSGRFELFKAAQSEGLERATEDYKHQFRALLKVEDTTPSQRYDRLRAEVAQIARELYRKLLRQIAADERTKEACARDVALLKEALSTVEGRLMPMLERVGDTEIDRYHANRNQAH